MAQFSNKPWGDIAESDYKDAESFCAASLIDTNAKGAAKSKAMCKLPVKEPSGAYNKNGIHAAAAALAGARGGVKASAEDKGKAARALIRLYQQMGEVAPEGVYRVAGQKRPQ